VGGAIAMGCSKVADSYELLLFGRFLSGLACGQFTVLVPLYISEVRTFRNT
jgi:predicted MFS family arabinose efflux permease